MSERGRPLEGIRVLDLTQILAGPYCTMVLGDLGADVVKVERPGGGDGTRQWGPPFVAGESAYYLQVNRSKRSIALDLKHPDGGAVVERLVASSDVVIENFLPGASRRYGVDPESVREINPRAVHCAIRGYPRDHPDADRPGYDFVMQGIGGIMSMQGEPSGEPMKVAVAIADIVAGLFAANGILAALVERERSGRGREVEVALLDAQVAWLANRAGDWLIGGIPPQRLGNAHPRSSPTRPSTPTTATSTWQSETTTSSSASAAKRAGTIWRTTSATRPTAAASSTATNWWRSCARPIAERTVAEWVAVLERAGVPGGPVLSLPELFDGTAAHMVEQVAHPTAGELRLVRSPIALEGERPAASRHPPGWASTARRCCASSVLPTRRSPS